MNIGFDLDRVFINTPPFIPDNIIDRLYRKHTDGIIAYRIPSGREQLLRKISHQPLFRPPIKTNITIIENVRNKNNKFFLISSRFSFLKNETENIMKKYNLVQLFDAMYFNFKNEQPHIFKNRILQNLQLDRYADDDLPLIEYLAKRNSRTTFYWLTKKTKRKLHYKKNIFQISDLSAIFVG